MPSPNRKYGSKMRELLTPAPRRKVFHSYQHNGHWRNRLPTLRTKIIIVLGVIAFWHSRSFEPFDDAYDPRVPAIRGANNPVTTDPGLEAQIELGKEIVHTGASPSFPEDAGMAVKETDPPSSETTSEVTSEVTSDDDSDGSDDESDDDSDGSDDESDDDSDGSDDESNDDYVDESEDESSGNETSAINDWELPTSNETITGLVSLGNSEDESDDRSEDDDEFEDESILSTDSPKEGGNETSASDDWELPSSNETITELVSLENPEAEPMNVAINSGSSASVNENLTDVAVNIGGSIASNTINTSVMEQSEATEDTIDNSTGVESATSDSSTIKVSEASNTLNKTESEVLSPEDGSSSSSNENSTSLTFEASNTTNTSVMEQSEATEGTSDNSTGVESDTSDSSTIKVSEASNTLNKTESEVLSPEDGSSSSANENSTSLAFEVAKTGNTTNTASESLNATKTTETNNLVTIEQQQHALWKATKEEFDATIPWKNESTFTTVSRDVYQQLVQKAHASVETVVKDVFTDCELHIVPGLQSDDEEKKLWGGKPKPRIQFMCFRDKDPVLQDDPCHTVNMCKVVLDEKMWKENISNSAFNTTSTNSTNSSIDSSNDHAKKSTLLMMADSIKYLIETKAFKATINKASYAYRSNRPFYIWIGNLNQDELNRREVESLEPAFGFKCATKELTNSIHYYKPIAFLVLLDILSSSSPSGESIFFLDADTDFTIGSFDRIDGIKINDQSSEGVDQKGPMGPESYLDLSPQASLMAIQNTKGKMLMNSGLMILRNTKWSRDFSALWWYGRCGGKDQLALWLVLYATFSAWTTLTAGDDPSVGTELKAEDPTQFAYPGQIFFEYNTASKKLFMHFRKYGHKLQAAWESVTKQRQKLHSSNGIDADIKDNYDYPIPTNTTLYNGGYPDSIQPRFLAPMELPHVLILPLRSVLYNKTIDNTAGNETISTEEKHLPVLKSEDGNSFVTHSKSLNSCSDGRCWPYVIE